MRRYWLGALGLCLLVSCRSKSAAPTAGTEPSATPITSRDAVSAQPQPLVSAPSTSASAPPLAKPQRTPAEPLDDACRAALLRARKLQADGELERARTEFLRAAGEKQVVNLQPLVELAYMELTRGGGSTDEAALLLRAGTSSSDTTLEAQAWYNLSLLHAQKGETEAERAALARSLARRENKTVSSKLAGRSRCVAEVVNQTDVKPVIVSGWKQVCARLGRCDDTVASDDDARKAACVWTRYGGEDEIHGCAEQGPWESTWNYSWFTNDIGFIAPLSGGRFFVASGRAGGWPARCTGNWWPKFELRGTYLVTEIEQGLLDAMPGRPLPENGNEQGVCLEAPGPTTTALFSTATGKLLGAVSVPPGFDVELRIDDDARRLALSGGGCDGHVPLDGTMRFVPK
jgi:hypothetical protein